MPNIEAIVREITRDLVPEFQKKLRAHLVEQDIEEILFERMENIEQSTLVS